MTSWFDSQIMYLDYLIEVVKGNCRNCKEPCQNAANGEGHPEPCECCKEATTFNKEDL